MSTGADKTCGPRQKWFREAYGQPWAYSTTGNSSARGFYLAIGLPHTAKGFTRETKGHCPSRAELLDMAKRMGYDEDGANNVALWIATATGPIPPAPPGVQAKNVPIPDEAWPKGSARNPHKAVAVVKAPVVLPAVTDAELLKASAQAADLLFEAQERGETLDPKVLALIKTVRGLSQHGKKALMAVAVAAGLMAGPRATQAANAVDAGTLRPTGMDKRKNKSRRLKLPA